MRSLRNNLVQSIRAFTVPSLQSAALELGHHFLYANLGAAQGKQDILDLLTEQYRLPAHANKSLDTLYDCMTDLVHKSGPQTGFVVVVEHIPTNSKFDKESREQLIDIFRDTADYWSDRKVPFRCFYSFAVARASAGQAVTIEAGEEPMPTDKIVDVSPMALRMSSPFNAGYWLAASTSTTA